jgi:hypothetical protein
MTDHSEAEAVQEAEAEMERAQHVAFAKQANQETWRLLEQAGRSEVDDNTMIHAAHASAFHWEMVGGAEESTRADWLLSHVYSVLGQATPALHYARRCLATCEREGLGGFDLAYAYEAMARANAVAHEVAAAVEWRAKAQEQATEIADAEDREIFLGDLAAAPWYDAVSS